MQPFSLPVLPLLRVRAYTLALSSADSVDEIILPKQPPECSRSKWLWILIPRRAIFSKSFRRFGGAESVLLIKVSESREVGSGDLLAFFERRMTVFLGRD